MTNQYTDFLQAKSSIVEWQGFEATTQALHPSGKPHQQDAIRWMLRMGRGLLAMSFGLGKTHCQVEAARLVHEHTGGKFLFVAPLGVRHQFTEEDGPRLGVDIRYVRTDEEVAECPSPTLFDLIEAQLQPGEAQ